MKSSSRSSGFALLTLVAFAVIQLPNGKLIDAMTLGDEIRPVASNVPGLAAGFRYPLLDTGVPPGAPRGAYRVIAAFFDPAGQIVGRPDAFLEAVGPFQIQ